MHRPWLALAALACSAAWGQAPSYSAANLVNAVSYAPGPFAANSVVSLFGANLAWDSGLFTNTSNTTLPVELDGVSVYVDNRQAPLLMVSQSQINFLIPSDEIPGAVPIHIVRQGVRGPDVTITLSASAPTLFPGSGGFILAEDWNNNYALITPDTPARPGDMIVVFAAGLGGVQVQPDVYGIGALADPIVNLSGLKVLLNGTAIDPSLIKYAGLTPGCAGLYQINLILPPNAPTDPQIQILMGAQSSQSDLKLSVR